MNWLTLEWFEDEIVSVGSELTHESVIHSIDGAWRARGSFVSGKLVGINDPVRVNLNYPSQEEIDADMGADEYKREKGV